VFLPAKEGKKDRKKEKKEEKTSKNSSIQEKLSKDAKELNPCLGIRDPIWERKKIN